MKEICETCKSNPDTCMYYPKDSNVVLVACDEHNKSKIIGLKEK